MKTGPLAAVVVLFAFAAMAWADEPKVRTERPAVPQLGQDRKITITLVGNQEQAEAGMTGGIVSFGIPFPPGALAEAGKIRVTTDTGEQPAVFTQALCPWRIDGKVGSVRSVLVQFEMKVAPGATRTVTVEYGVAPAKTRAALVPVEKTLVDAGGQKGPQIWALLPAKWLCDSWLVGPQMPAAENKLCPEYEKCAARSFDAQKRDMSSTRGANWLFDRTTTIYKMYVRTGEQKYLAAAYHCAHYVRQKSDARGAFTLRRRHMYVYPRAQAIHYLLTGDPRALALLKAQAALLDGLAAARRVTYVPGGGMWTERNLWTAFYGQLHPYQILGGEKRLAAMKRIVDTLYAHQSTPPDGKPADGSWRHRWAQHDAEEGTYEGGSSAWMTALLLDPMFEYWLLTGDARVPEMITRYGEFLIAKGLVPDGSSAYYVINCFGASRAGGGMAQHNLEMAYMLAMGMYFTTDAAQSARFAGKLKPLLASGCSQTHTRPPRRFNWAFQNSSLIPWLLANRPEGAQASD